MFKNNKGFTLIELLAVIVVLALIIVIATMSVNKTIVRTRTTSFENSMDVAVKTARRILADEDLTLDIDTLKSNIEYSTSDYDYELSETYNGYILKIISKENGKFSNVDFGTIDKNENYYYKDNENGENQIITMIDIEGDVNNISKVKSDTVKKDIGLYPESCEFIERKDKYDVGDRISLCNYETGKSEKFYVISDDGENITALAEYNLMIGDDYKSDKNYGLQMIQEQNQRFDIAFSDNIYCTKDDGYMKKADYYSSLYDENSKLYKYINDYKTYLENNIEKKINEARIITVKELRDLGCNTSSRVFKCNTSPDWVYKTSYWTATPYGSKGYTELIVVQSNGWLSKNRYSNKNTFGIRPVIAISKSEL